jgi:hypothetical protein
VSGSIVVSRQSFNVTACVDWLDVVITTSRPTQHQHLQKAFLDITGTKCWVENLDKQAGSVGTVFGIRVHDVDDYEKLARALRELSRQYPFVDLPKITAIEVACDFRNKTGSIPETLAMTHRLQSSLFADGAHHRQFDPASGKVRFLNHPGDRLDPSMCFYIGDKGDPRSWRCYFKTKDKEVLLPEDQWRARVEVTLEGVALQEYGLNLLADIQRFQFSKLTGLFRFRRPIEPEQMAGGSLLKLTAIKKNREINDLTPERGIHSFDAVGRRDKFRRTRAESSYLQADDELREAVKGALRRLTL